MQQPAKPTYEFGSFRLDPEKRVLLKDGETVQLTPKAIEVLLLLVESRGHIVAKDEFWQRLWPDRFVEEGTLTVNISTLRKALGENRGEHRYIVTVPGRGYRFVADVHEIWEAGSELVLEEHAQARVVIEQVEQTPQLQADYDITGASGALLPLADSRFSRWSRPRKWAALGLLLMAALVTTYFLTAMRSEPAPQKNIHSIAVLPFKVISSDSNSQYVSFGMTEMLVVRLSNIKRIQVRLAAATPGDGDLARNYLEIGQKLHVDVVLDGSVQKLGDKLRVTVQLVQVKDGASLWAKKFDADAQNLLALQDMVSEQAARALLPQMSREEQQLLTKHSTDNTEAYDLYVMGRYFWNRRNVDDLNKAVQYFKQALAKDSEYALAWAGLADAYILLGSTGYDRLPREVIENARDAALRAIEIDNTLAEAHTSMGIIRLQYDWNWSEAERELNKALELNPNYQAAQYWYVVYLIAMGQLNEAIEISKQSSMAAPDSLILGMNVARSFYYARRYDEAVEQCLNLLRNDSNHFSVRFILASAYTQKGNYEQAIAEFQKLRDDFKNNLVVLTGLGTAYAKGARREEALEIINELQRQAQSKYVAPTYMATIYAYLGDKDRAFAGLEQAYQEHSSTMININVEPTLDPLRSDPRFADLVQRVGHTP